MEKIVRVITVCTCFGLFSCSSSPKHSHPAPLLPGMKAEAAPEKAAVEAVKEATEPGENLDLESPGPIENGEQVLDDSSELPSPTPAKSQALRKHEIPFQFNQKVAQWIEYFSQHDRERFQRFFDRGEPYREVIENILEENQVPADLFYLGMIESGFNAHAKSSAKAVGVWQFMQATGKMYGLASDPYLDERRDPIRATEAAAKMLRDLYRDFHSWYLAMAAYNAGPGRIRQAVRRGGTNDFWELVRRNKLPRETMDYVPKFLAARYIGENPDLFAFYINEEKKYPDVELVKVPSPVSFDQIEKTCSIPAGTLQFVNPQILKGYTHPGHASDEIWIPTQYQASVLAKHDELLTQRLAIKPVKAAPRLKSPRTQVATYRVKRGDSLKSIARHRGLSVAYLKRVNNIKGDHLIPGQRLKLSASSYYQHKTHSRKRARRSRS